MHADKKERGAEKKDGQLIKTRQQGPFELVIEAELQNLAKHFLYLPKVIYVFIITTFVIAYHAAAVLIGERDYAVAEDHLALREEFEKDFADVKDMCQNQAQINAGLLD